MSKRSGHKRAAKKERKGKKSTRGYRKGSKSKTMKGEKDFTTKKTSKVFNRRKHYQKHAKGSRVNRRPYHKKGGSEPAKSIDARKTVPQKVSHSNLEIKQEAKWPNPNFQTIVLNNDTSGSTAPKVTASGLVDAINSVLPKQYHANQVSTIKLSDSKSTTLGKLNPSLFSSNTTSYLLDNPTKLDAVAEAVHKYLEPDTVLVQPTEGSPYRSTLGDGAYGIGNTEEYWEHNLVTYQK